jgi:hypothetical protein
VNTVDRSYFKEVARSTVSTGNVLTAAHIDHMIANITSYVRGGKYENAYYDHILYNLIAQTILENIIIEVHDVKDHNVIILNKYGEQTTAASTSKAGAQITLKFVTRSSNAAQKGHFALLVTPEECTTYNLCQAGSDFTPNASASNGFEISAPADGRRKASLPPLRSGSALVGGASNALTRAEVPKPSQTMTGFTTSTGTTAGLPASGIRKPSPLRHSSDVKNQAIKGVNAPATTVNQAAGGNTQTYERRQSADPRQLKLLQQQNEARAKLVKAGTVDYSSKPPNPTVSTKEEEPVVQVAIAKPVIPPEKPDPAPAFQWNQPKMLEQVKELCQLFTKNTEQLSLQGGLFNASLPGGDSGAGYGSHAAKENVDPSQVPNPAPPSVHIFRANTMPLM